MAYLYGVFVPGGGWGITRASREAMKRVKERSGYVTRMVDCPDTRYWDKPTFFLCSEVVADFRPFACPDAKGD